MTNCPKCGVAINSQTTCQECGLVFAKWQSAEKAKQADAAAMRAAEEQKLLKKTELAEKAEKERDRRLSSCAACDAKISKTAKLCPHCGEKQRRPVGSLAYAIGALVLIALVISILGDQEREISQKAAADKLLQERPDILHRTAARKLCDSRLRTGLRDPDSLVINQVEQHYSPATTSQPVVVLTSYDIRAKNGFGGYVNSQHICTVEIDKTAATVTDFIKTSR